MTFILILIAALGSGLIAGTFFAFSTFVMQSLARLPASEGVAAMQSINLVILKSPFMPVFFGTAVLSVLALIQSLRQWHEPHAAWLLAGGSLYLAGSLLVTVAFNVPRNIALDAVRPGAPDAAEKWARYVEIWTRWNHVRTIASLAASSAFSMALI